MDEREEKIREMERQLEGLQQEVDTLKRKKRLKPWKVILIVAGCIAALVAVVLAVVFGMMNSDKESPAMAEELLWAIVEQDADRAYALTCPGALEREEFDQGFGEMCAAWLAAGGGDTFELKRTSWSMKASGGVTQYEAGYEVASGGARFSFKLTRVEQGDNTGMIGAKISQILP